MRGTRTDSFHNILNASLFSARESFYRGFGLGSLCQPDAWCVGWRISACSHLSVTILSGSFFYQVWQLHSWFSEFFKRIEAMGSIKQESKTEGPIHICLSTTGLHSVMVTTPITGLWVSTVSKWRRGATVSSEHSMGRWRQQHQQP